jgi:CDP-diacylglycerol--glycerol-3-phosphate 3-phosphatidyltransferase
MNLPNQLATLRILLAPVMFFFLVERESMALSDIHVTWLNYFAALIFVIASLTDFFDGYIARQWNQSTKLGAILDPLADKMLVLAAFLGLMVIDMANAWAVFLILSREFFITGLRIVAVGEGRDVSASSAGKWKTGAQITAIGFLMMDWPFGQALLWLAVALTLYSGAQYVWSYLKND